jgi:hypothetical protein
LPVLRYVLGDFAFLFGKKNVGVVLDGFPSYVADADVALAHSGGHDSNE